jgi:hypothetical protein
MQDAGDFVTDFHFSFGPMNSLGWDVQTVAWRSAPDWNQFDAVYICTPWDYPQHVAEFKDVLESIEASSAVLFNDLAIVQWNLEKTYMRDMEARGDDIVPSSWYDDFDIEDVPGYFTEHGVDKVVIKPIIGGNAKDTFVLSNPVGKELLGVLSETFKGRRFFFKPINDNKNKQCE